jgi:diacylglycerol kinase family enzyme
MDQTRFHVVFNPTAGTAGSLGLDVEALAALFATAQLPARIDPDASDDLEARIRRAVDSGAEIIVAAGGDGTATAIANALFGTKRTLAVLPLGTANLLARDLGLPPTLEETVNGLAAMETRWIDVGEVNGHYFLHKVVIGVVPGIAAAREALRGAGDWRRWATFSAWVVRRIARARRFAVDISSSGSPRHVRRVQSMAVANNEYDAALGHFFSRKRLDGGMLTLYLLKRISLRDVVRLSVEMVLGTWRDDDSLDIERAEALTLRTRKRVVNVMLDGEVMTLTTPLRFRIHKGALAVLAPARPDAGSPATESG